MVERMMPVYQEALALRDADMAGLDPAARLAIGKGKLAALEMVTEWAAVLFPEDDDG